MAHENGENIVESLKSEKFHNEIKQKYSLTLSDENLAFLRLIYLRRARMEEKPKPDFNEILTNAQGDSENKDFVDYDLDVAMDAVLEGKKSGPSRLLAELRKLEDGSRSLFVNDKFQPSHDGMRMLANLSSVRD